MQLHSVYDEQQPLALGSLKPIPAPLPPPHRGKHVTLHFAQLLLRHPPPTHSQRGKIVAEFSNRFYFVNSGIIWPFCWRSLARWRAYIALATNACQLWCSESGGGFVMRCGVSSGSNAMKDARKWTVLRYGGRTDGIRKWWVAAKGASIDPLCFAYRKTERGWISKTDLGFGK